MEDSQSTGQMPPAELESIKIASTTIPMSAARTCAKCLLISEEDECPVCENETTLIVIPQHILMDQLARYVVSNIASLGSKVEALTDEIRTQNKIESEKKLFGELKNKVMASLSKQLKEEMKDGEGEGAKGN